MISGSGRCLQSRTPDVKTKKQRITSRKKKSGLTQFQFHRCCIDINHFSTVYIAFSVHVEKGTGEADAYQSPAPFYVRFHDHINNRIQLDT